jgi:hypothetical protein
MAAGLMEDVIKKSTVARWRKTILEKLCKEQILNKADLLHDVLAKLATEPPLQVGWLPQAAVHRGVLSAMSVLAGITYIITRSARSLKPVQLASSMGSSCCMLKSCHNISAMIWISCVCRRCSAATLSPATPSSLTLRRTGTTCLTC